MPWEWPVGAVCAFVLALIATPAGVSGAVLLLPVQLSVLGVPSPAVTPTNLLFNVTATPGALLRFWQERRVVGPLSRLLVAGTLPGVIAGSVIRVELLATFLTSVVGVAAYQVLEVVHGGPIAAEWALGAWIGAGGFAGSYLGARLQSRLPEASIRRLLGLIACVVAVRYIQTAASEAPARPAHATTT
jgi:uncharacterized membrane protein YfcA